MEKNKINFCMGCMSSLASNGKCTKCGFTLETYNASPRCLPPGIVLADRYYIGRVIGEGSFGVTYIGRDILLGIVIAIKEYFPLSYGYRDVRKDSEHIICAYEGNDKKGLEQFYNEAKILSRFHMLEGIVSVRDFFYANQTAYIVMDYIDGITLKEYVKKNGSISGEDTLKMMKPVIRSLHTIHQAGIIHRDISPDNLLLTGGNKLVLVDFGSARVENRTITQSMTVIFKRGYTPEEQYLRRGKLGAWSDVYALCATMYFMLTGIVPNEAIERMLQDQVLPLSKMPEIMLSQKQKDAIMHGISVRPEKRLQNMQELSDSLYNDIKCRRNLFCLIHLKRMLIIISTAMLLFGIGYQVKEFILGGHQNKTENIFNNSSMINNQTLPLVSLKPTNVVTQTIKPSVSAQQTKKEITMKSFIGLTKKQAKKSFKELGDKNLKIVWKEKYSTKSPKGKVIAQSIVKNTKYSSGDYKKLVLTVSKGKKYKPVPAATPKPTMKPQPAAKQSTKLPTIKPDKTAKAKQPKDDFIGSVP